MDKECLNTASLESKLAVLESENEALSLKIEENLLLNRVFEEINSYDESEDFIKEILESICILLDVQFSGLFELMDNQCVFKEHYVLFAHEKNPLLRLDIHQDMLEKILYNKSAFLQQGSQTFSFEYPNSNFIAHHGVVVPFNSSRIKNRFFIFINDEASALLKERMGILQKIVGIIVARYEKFYYQNALKTLNELLEQKVSLRTYELFEKNEELRVAKEKVEHSQRELSITLQSIGDGVIATDARGLVTMMNPVAEKLCGWNLEDAKGKHLGEVFFIINAHTRKTCENPVEKVLETGSIVGLANHTVLVSKEGLFYDISDSAAPIRDEEGHIVGIVLVFSDVTEKYAQAEKLRIAQEKLTKNLENQLYIDDLTKLKSRACLLRDMKNASYPAIILVDINSFRTINELYGVEVGNEALIAFAGVLKEFGQSKGYSLYRLSGDEFVFFKDTPHSNIHKCNYLLDLLLKIVQETPVKIASLGETLLLDIFVGASFEKDNPLGTANIALNYAKQHCKPYIIFSSEIDSLQEITYGAKWKKKIVWGIQTDAFLPFFQPIVDREQNIVKYEALMRLRDLEDGKASYVSPYAFLEIATKTHHYDEISQMNLLKSLAVCAQNQIAISLNLNYQDVLNKPLCVLLKNTILKKGIAHLVTFEIVESQNIQNYDLLKAFIAEFKALGIHFAIDDFGTGFSNFTHIFEFSPDFIKIDGSLIKSIHTDKKSFELVKAIVFFSKELGIKTVAEFVHSKEVFDVTLGLGVDFFQGYYFGEPRQK